MLWKMLLEAASRRPRGVLFSEGTSVTTLEQLVAAAGGQAARLAREGVVPGDAVGLLARGGSRIASAIYGIIAAGGCVVPLNPASKQGEVQRALVPCKPRVVLCEDDLADSVRACGLRPLSIDAARAGMGRMSEINSLPIDESRPAFCLFSTGSTGRPKRVSRTHGMMMAEAEQYQAAVRLGEEDLILGVAPLFHSYGICCVMLSAIRSGARARLLAEFMPEQVMAYATAERPTVLAGSPFHYSIMASLKPRAGTDLSSLRWSISCGAPAPEAVIRKFHERFGLHVRQLYGASEVGSVSLNVSADPGMTAMSVGTPLPGVKVRVVSEGGGDARPGEVGEVAVRSAAGSHRYEDLQEMTAQCFRDGWFLSGDLGRMDEAGNLYITGRVKLLINAGGNKVDPLEVEQVLEEHPAVAEAAVVGVPAAHGLEAVKAVVVLRSAAAAEQLRAFCADRLVGYKVPRIFEFREQLPRSPTGKLLRKDLLEDGE